MLIIIVVNIEIDKCNDVKPNIVVNQVRIESRCIPFTCNISHLPIAIMWLQTLFQETIQISV